MIDRVVMMSVVEVENGREKEVLLRSSDSSSLSISCTLSRLAPRHPLFRVEQSLLAAVQVVFSLHCFTVVNPMQYNLSI